MRNEGVSEPAGIPRRTWIRLIPVLSAMARSNAQTPTHPNTSAQQNFAAPKITKENLRDALRLVELEFSDLVVTEKYLAAYRNVIAACKNESAR